MNPPTTMADLRAWWSTYRRQMNEERDWRERNGVATTRPVTEADQYGLTPPEKAPFRRASKGTKRQS